MMPMFDAALLDLQLPIRGLAAGLIIAAPVGPVNVLCIRRSLQKGWRAGILSGVGAALADTVYGGIAGFGISLVIAFLIREEFWFRMIGGIVLVAIGVIYYLQPPQKLTASEDKSSAHSDIVSTFLLAATNPTTILSFLVVLATLGLGQQRPLWQTSLLVGGIFCGSMAWWIILASGANMLRDKMTDQSMVWLNRIGGIAIGLFGLLNVILSRFHKH
jgi:threonine/homoserine/homoserine lactone efflux protein